MIGDSQAVTIALNPSNSMGLKLGLFNFSHKPIKSIVLLLRIQLLITENGSTVFRYFAISVNEMKSFSPRLEMVISVPLTNMILFFAIVNLLF